jgi:hypothetical protein
MDDTSCPEKNSCHHDFGAHSHTLFAKVNNMRGGYAGMKRG